MGVEAECYLLWLNGVGGEDLEPGVREIVMR